MTRWTARLLHPWDFPGKNTGMGCRILLQGILSISLCLSQRYLGLPRWLSGKRICLQRRRCRRHRFDPWVAKMAWRREIPQTEEPVATVHGATASDRTGATECGPQGLTELLRGWVWHFNVPLGGSVPRGQQDLHLPQSSEGYSGGKRGRHQAKLGGE